MAIIQTIILQKVAKPKSRKSQSRKCLPAVEK